MKQAALGKLAAVLSVSAVLMVGARYSIVHAQQTGPGGAPGAASGGTCGVNNIPCINTANTFTASQAFSSSSTSGTSLTLANASSGGQAWILTSEGQLGNTGGLSVNLNGNRVFGWQSGGAMGIPAGQPLQWGCGPDPIGTPCSAIYQVGADQFAFGNSSFEDTSGWLMVSAIGNGASGNTDLRGHLTLSSGTASYNFLKSYAVAPTCVATDTTTTAAVKVASTTTTLTLTGTGTDTLNYLCAD